MRQTVLTLLFATIVACGDSTEETTGTTTETSTSTTETSTSTSTTETAVTTTETGVTTGDYVSYGQISAMIVDECAGCHGGASPADGLNLEGDAGYDAIVGVSSGQAIMKLVEPGSPNDSYFYHKVVGTHTDVGGSGAQMPIGNPLSAQDMEKIETWIVDGAWP